MIIDSKIASYFVCEPPLCVYSRQQKGPVTKITLSLNARRSARLLLRALWSCIIHGGKTESSKLLPPHRHSCHGGDKSPLSQRALSAHCWSAGSCTLDHFTPVFPSLPAPAWSSFSKPHLPETLLLLTDCQEKRLQKGLWECESVRTLACAPVHPRACASIRRRQKLRSNRFGTNPSLLQSPDRLWSLIKQGIMGLYGDYHYRPLERSSANVFLSPRAPAQWFSMDYMRPQDMCPHSLNQFLRLPPFNKDWFLCRTPTH